MVLAAPPPPARFAADGNFAEWDAVAAVRDLDDGPPPPAACDLVEVKTAEHDRGFFVYGSAAAPFFEGAEQSLVRVFVDADGNRSTGFDLGDLGADVMIEAAGRGGALEASGAFAFDPQRASDDWHGWQRSGAAALAVSGTRLEVALSGAFARSAAVLVALSCAGGEDLLDPPVAAEGALRVEQRTNAPEVVPEGARGETVETLTLSSAGGARAVDEIAFAPTGGANFSLVESGRLTMGGGRVVAADAVLPGKIVFRLDPPAEVPAAGALSASLALDFAGGKAFRDAAGSSLGAQVDSIAFGGGAALLVLRPRSLAPVDYLGFVAAAPVIDGALGEWRLATAAADPLDAAAAAGQDLVGVRAMASTRGAAFYAETRGPVLPGAALEELPLAVTIPAPAVSSPGAPSPPPATPPAPHEEPPPLAVDDRLLVYFDADNNPATGFNPALDVPIGAEFVIQVGGRFSAVASAHLLEFAGATPLESRWIPRGTLKAVAAGFALEGEVPALVLARSGTARVLFQTVGWTGRTGDLSDALQDLSVAAPDPDALLHFRSVTFDPLRGPPPVRPSLLSEAPNGFWVVQLKAAPTTAAQRALEAAGATLFGYVHSNAYIARMDASAADEVRAMAEVRWVGIYQPAFKFPLDPAAWGDGPLNLLALLFERPKDLESQVAAAGGALLSATDMSLRVRINGSAAERLGSIADIQYVEPENRRVPLNDIARRAQGVNLTFDRHGLNGTHIVVGISDTGIDFTHPAFDDTGNSTTGPKFDGRIVAYFRYGGSYGDSDGHGTHTAGSIAGDGDLSTTVNNTTAGAAGMFRGVAPAASLAVMEIIGSSPPADDKVFADQESANATVSSNSWGYTDGSGNPITDYDTSAYLTDQSVIDANTSKAGLQPMTVVFAAGNAGGSGSDTVGSPGTAKNVITVGASESDRGIDTYADNASSIASFSSLGPTDDGRIKPDVVAMGTYILSTQSRTSGCTCSYGGWDLSWTGSNYAFSSGTSQATPHVAGIAALVEQHLNDTYGRIPSPALVKAAIINGAEDLGYGFEATGGATGPMKQGWGRVNVSRSVDGPDGGTILLYDEGADVGSGDVIARRFEVKNGSSPLKVTVVWTDQPGNPADTKTLAELVNDLDLVVRAPNGTYYHGNKFNGSWSRENNTTYDRLNNVENVFVPSPANGTWTIEVTGYSIKSAQQRFALAVSGNLTEKAPPSVADAREVPGAPSGAKFGWNATAAGSIDGDGYNDLVVGAPGASGGNGSVYIFFGGSGVSLAGIGASTANITLNGSGGEGFGSSVDTSGDFDGDGLRDLLVGAPGGGKAYLFLGSTNWTNRTANVTFNGSAADLFGGAVRLLALDNKTGAEAVVGAPQNNGARGAVYVFSGSATSGTWNASSANATLQGSAADWRLGTSLSGGDADGDGKADLAVGAPGASLVLLVHGGAGASALAFNATISGIPGTAFGASVALDGDYNGDGKADLLVGAPLANDSAGAAYVFFGKSPLADNSVIKYYFFDDMESGAAKWDEMDGTTITTTAWGVESTVFYGPGLSGHAWQDSSGNYANLVDLSIAFNQSINLSGATNPLMTFVYRADLEATATNFDGFMVKYTLNNGSTWTQLDSTDAQGLYDAKVDNPGGPPSSKSAIASLWAFTYDSFVWRKVSFNLTSLAGNSAVKLRFEFASDSSTVADGIYLDDIAVREAHPSSPNFTVYGEAAGDGLGFAVASMGDLNHDGYADLALGAPNAPAGLKALAGAAYVVAGASALNGSVSALDSAEALRGTSSGSSLGWSIAPISSFNGSNLTLLFAGTPGTNGSGGGAVIGDATSPIPEFSQAALPMAAAAALPIVVRNARRRRA